MTTETEAPRAQFEAWATAAYRLSFDDDTPLKRYLWAAYQAGHAAAKAETADVGEPVAFAHFAENGNIRLWAPERPRDLAGNAAHPLYTADQMRAYVDADRAMLAARDAEDAARYRWLAAHCRSTAEHWGGRWSIVVEGPAPKSHDSKDDFDAAIDAARARQEHKQ